MANSISIPTLTAAAIALPAAFSLASSSPAQDPIGGESVLQYQIDGAASFDLLGGVSDAGDVNGDGYDDFIVGAPWTDPNGLSRAGSAYVYSGFDGSILYQWDGEDDYDRFGDAVSGAGDVDGDGFSDLVIGAFAAGDGVLSNAGSAYVYSGATGVLLYKWTGPTSWDYFGFAVSSAGDVNADGHDDILVGMPWHEANGVWRSGNSLVYSGANGALLYQMSGVEEYDYFGHAVSDAGDVNADGYDDFIVGAYAADIGTLVDHGAAYVFSGRDGSQLHQWTGFAAEDTFGRAVSSAGDVNQDGHSDLFISAELTDNNNLVDAGSAYVYCGATGQLIFQWDGEADGDSFGRSISEAGDVNGDGYPDLIVGAYWTESPGFTNTGRFYVYSGADSELIHYWEGQNDYDNLGIQVSSAGDVNQDGYADVIASAWGYDPSGLSDAGVAYVYSFFPYLRSLDPRVSAFNGGTIRFELDFPAYTSGYEYRVLLSRTGRGIIHYGVDIPLAWDPYVVDSYQGVYPVAESGMHGILDLNGDSNANLTVPAGLPATLIGKKFYFAAIANPVGLTPELSSIAVALEITP